MNKKIVLVWQYSSWPGTTECSGYYEKVHCHGEALAICPATILLAHCEANTAGSFVDLLIDHLVLWQELCVDNASHIKECDQYDFDCLALFGLSNVSDFH